MSIFDPLMLMINRQFDENFENRLKLVLPIDVEAISERNPRGRGAWSGAGSRFAGAEVQGIERQDFESHYIILHPKDSKRIQTYPR